MANFMPKTHIFKALVNQGLPWWKMLAELIDNSFDHGADRVEIREMSKPRSLVIDDNGWGIQDLVSALSIGSSKPTGQSRMGRYGIGLKDAWLGTGDKIDVIATHNGATRQLILDVSDFDENWIGPDPIELPFNGRKGTRIQLHLRKSKQMPQAEVYEKLSWVFSPGLLDGKQIVRILSSSKREPLRPRGIPELCEAVQDSFEVDGKPVSINIGIIKPGTKLFDGPFCFAHLHRIIECGSLGSKGMSCQNMAGMVILGDKWELSRNKDAITNNEDELEEEIHKRIKHLLFKAESLSQDIASIELREELETLLNAAVGECKRESRQSKRESSGTIIPQDSGQRRTKAKEIHEQLPGSVITETGKRARGFKIDWQPRHDDLIGTFDHRNNTVTMNTSHEYVRAAKEDKNTMALIPMAVSVLSDWMCNNKDQQRTMFPVEEFAPTFSQIMKSMRYTSNE
jgi:hypothetical protein